VALELRDHLGAEKAGAAGHEHPLAAEKVHLRDRSLCVIVS
jgi:hypothetical protein